MIQHAGHRRISANAEQPRLAGNTSDGLPEWQVHMGVLLGYTLLTLLFTYPLAKRFGSELLGRGNDLWIFQWNNWWVSEALSAGLDVYHTPYMFHPQGVPLHFHSFSWFNSGLWLILRTVASPVAAHNTTVVIGYILSGYTMYLLAKELTDCHQGAFVAGVVFAFFRHRGVNHLHLFSIQWIPLTILFLTRLARTELLRYGIWAGISMGLSALCGWQQLMMLAFWLLLWLVYHLLRRQWDNPVRVILGLSIACCLCVCLTAPLLWPVIRDGLLQGEAALVAGALGEGGTDLLSYLLPSEDHPLIRSGLWAEVYDRFFRVQHTHNFLGFVALGLIAWAVKRQRAVSIFWCLVMLSSVAMALGPVLEVNDVSFVRIPMPYRLVDSTLVGRVLRRPDRLNIVFSLGAAIMVGFGAGDILQRLGQRPGPRAAACMLLTAIMFSEYAVLPFPTSKPSQSRFFEQLRQEAGQFAVADFPIGYLAHDKWYMYGQTLHERPMVGGHVSRVPPQAHDFMDRIPVLSEARGSAPTWGELDDISRQLSPLVDANVRYVLLHKDRASSRRIRSWREWFATQPQFEDNRLVVFRTSPRYGRDFDFEREIGDGMGIIEAQLSTDVLPQEGLLEAQVVWGTRKEPSTDWEAYLALTDAAGDQVQRAAFAPCDGWPTSTWGRDALARGEGRLQVNPFVRRGRYTVVLGLSDPASSQQAGEPLAVGQVEVQAIRRMFGIPEMDTTCHVRFGTALKLLGHDLHKAADQLVLKLHWQALRRMEESYTFFVHLIEVETGELVAQADVIPHDWTYPTTWWEAEEVVSDEVRLPLVDVPPGRYRLAVGVYNGDSGERLTITDSDKPVSDRYIVPNTIHVR